MKKLLTSFGVVGAFALALAIGASAATGGYTLFGDAQIVSPGNASAHAAEATSTGANAFGGVDFSVPSGLTVSQLSNLATDYQFTAGTCGLGSPRFAVEVTNGTTTGNIFFYIGPPPNYTGCPPHVWAHRRHLASPDLPGLPADRLGEQRKPREPGDPRGRDAARRPFLRAVCRRPGRLRQLHRP